MVPVKKRDGTVRLYGSYDVTVNVTSPLERYPLPRVEELFNTLSGGARFTKIDLAEAYLQLELDESCRECLTINTHKGLISPAGRASANMLTGWANAHPVTAAAHPVTRFCPPSRLHNAHESTSLRPSL